MQPAEHLPAGTFNLLRSWTTLLSNTYSYLAVVAAASIAVVTLAIVYKPFHKSTSAGNVQHNAPAPAPPTPAAGQRDPEAQCSSVSDRAGPQGIPN